MLAGVEAGDVDVHEPHALGSEGGAGRGGEVAPPGADADHDVGLPGQGVRGRRTGRADRPHLLRVTVQQRPLARLALADRDAGRLAERLQRLLGARVVHPSPGDDHRPTGRPDHRGGRGDPGVLGRRAGDVPGALGEQLDRPVVRLGLHVLRQRQRHRAGLGRVGEHPHRRQQGRRQLLGPPDPVEVARHRPERVVDRHVTGVRRLELLQHRGRAAGREGVGGEQQHREPVDRRQRGTGDHVRASRARPRPCTPRSAAGPSAGRRPPTCAPSPARCGPARRADPGVRPASSACVSCCSSA